VYTIRHSDELQRVHEHGGRETFTERKRWVRAKSLLEAAKRSGEELAVVFAPAQGTRYLFAWALLEEVVLEDKQTKYKFSNMTLFSKRHRKTSLRKASNAQPLAETFIRPYAICHTPAFLQAQPSPEKGSQHS
jgi:hypothetical protein